MRRQNIPYKIENNEDLRLRGRVVVSLSVDEVACLKMVEGHSDGEGSVGLNGTAVRRVDELA